MKAYKIINNENTRLIEDINRESSKNNELTEECSRINNENTNLINDIDMVKNENNKLIREKEKIIIELLTGIKIYLLIKIQVKNSL
jgi:predicted nuclease with TOPRIM domain